MCTKCRDSPSADRSRIDTSTGPAHQHLSIRILAPALGMHDLERRPLFECITASANIDKTSLQCLLIDQLHDGFASCIDIGGVGRGW